MEVMKSFARIRRSTILMTGLALTCASIAAPARADEVYTFVVKKQEEKKKSRWSLAEWLDTRDRMRLMDLWLALHSPSPYEFYLGAEPRWMSVPAQSFQGFGMRYTAGAFASIFGLTGERQTQLSEESLGLFNLRIFGFNDQNTNITLQAGIRSRDGVAQGAATRGAVAGTSMTFYLTRFFGIAGHWRHYFQPSSGAVGAQTGNRYEGGAFIDFNFLRIYGNYLNEREAGVGVTGFALGTRFYF